MNDSYAYLKTNTKKNIFVLTLLILLVAYTAWLVQKTNQTGNTTSLASGKPDSIIKNMTIYQTNDQGELEKQLYSPYVEHYPQNNTYQYDKPRAIIYPSKPDQAPWHVSAEKGTATHGSDEITLFGGVIIEQKDKDRSSTTIKTTEASLYPKKKLAHTDKAVIITQPGLSIHAIGADVFFEQKKVHFLNQVRGIYDENQYKKN